MPKGRKGEEFVLGIEEAVKILDELNVGAGLPKQIVNDSLRKALLPVKQMARQKLKAIKSKSKGGRVGFSKLMYVYRGVSIKPLAKSSIGMRVKVSGPDIPMGRKMWNIEGVAKLFSAGSYLTPDRNGHGFFKGYGNYIKDSGVQLYPMVKRLFWANLRPDANRIAAKTVRRWGRKYGR